MNKINYQKEMEIIIEKYVRDGVKPSLLLHACCAPCSSYVLEYLNTYFDITIYFYNPNISPETEYQYRAEELINLIMKMNLDNKVKVIIENYNSEEFYKMSKGMEQELEGGIRCFACYDLRLKKTAILAKERGFDFFTTTLSISPMKNAEKLNEIGEKLSKEYKVSYLYSDFKKKNGYKRSIELSKEYNLYRQNYCGCEFSKIQSLNKDTEII